MNNIQERKKKEKKDRWKKIEIIEEEEEERGMSDENEMMEPIESLLNGAWRPPDQTT